MKTFIEGLNLHIHDEVEARQPHTMIFAISFVRVHERKINEENYRTNEVVDSSIITKPTTPIIPNQGTKKLTQEDHHSKEGKYLMIKAIASKPKAVNFDEEDTEYDGIIELFTYIVHAQPHSFNPLNHGE